MSVPSAETPDVWQSFKDLVYQVLGMPGLIAVALALVVVPAVFYIWTHWQEVQTWPGVTKVLGRRSLPAPPKADPATLHDGSVSFTLDEDTPENPQFFLVDGKLTLRFRIAFRNTSSSRRKIWGTATPIYQDSQAQQTEVLGVHLKCRPELMKGHLLVDAQTRKWLVTGVWEFAVDEGAVRRGRPNRPGSYYVRLKIDALQDPNPLPLFFPLEWESIRYDETPDLAFL